MRNRVLESAGRRCSVWVNLVSLETEETAFVHWSGTIFPSPVPGRVSHLHPAVSGGAALGTEQASVLVSPWPGSQCRWSPSWGLCAALFNSSVLMFMTLKLPVEGVISAFCCSFCYLIIHCSALMPQTSAGDSSVQAAVAHPLPAPGCKFCCLLLCQVGFIPPFLLAPAADDHLAQVDVISMTPELVFCWFYVPW